MKRTYSVRGAIFRKGYKEGFYCFDKVDDEMLAAQLRREVMRGRLVLLSEAEGSQDSLDPHRLFRGRV